MSPSKKYIPRLLDQVVERHLKVFGAIEVTGTMWSGKTRLSLEHAKSSCNLDDTETRTIAQMSPEVILRGEKPRVIDEWQLVPPVWDAVRRSVDASADNRGMYLLTGSSCPAKDAVAHSGAGRISRLRLWPLSLFEAGKSSGEVSLSALFNGEFAPSLSASNTQLTQSVQPSKSTTNPIDITDITKFICHGGWPGAADYNIDDAALVVMQYIDALVNSQDSTAPETPNDLERFLQSLARNIGSAPKIDTLVKDMNFLTQDRVTETGRRRVRNLLEYFTGRFVIDEVRGWDAPIKSPQRLRAKPHYNFADPSIPAALLGVNHALLLKNMQLTGQLFEQMCIRDLLVYASVLPFAKTSPLYYYRDADGLEVDVIIELRDGRWAGIEVKLGANKAAAGEKNLLRLADKIKRNEVAKNPQPAFLMVLVGVGKYAYKTDGGVYVVPITCLGP